MTETTAPTSSQLAKSTERASVTRRDFLTLTWKGLLALSGALGLGGLWKFLSYQPDPAPPSLFDLGAAETYPTGIRATVPQAQAVLTHTPQGFRAWSLVCPHLGCIVDLSEEGYACPCHGSRFAMDGALRHGPADRPMRELAVKIDDNGHLILDTRKSA